MLTMLLACKVCKLLPRYRPFYLHLQAPVRFMQRGCFYPRVLRFTYSSGQIPVEGIDSDTVEFEVLNSEFNDMSQLSGALACTGM